MQCMVACSDTLDNCAAHAAAAGTSMHVPMLALVVGMCSSRAQRQLADPVGRLSLSAPTIEVALHPPAAATAAPASAAYAVGVAHACGHCCCHCRCSCCCHPITFACVSLPTHGKGLLCCHITAECSKHTLWSAPGDPCPLVITSVIDRWLARRDAAQEQPKGRVAE
jgi:hypothetical protein